MNAESPATKSNLYFAERPTEALPHFLRIRFASEDGRIERGQLRGQAQRPAGTGHDTRASAWGFLLLVHRGATSTGLLGSRGR